jgi:hypothetical protein
MVRMADSLHDLVATHRDNLIDRCHAKAAERSVSAPPTVVSDHAVSVCLQQLLGELHGAASQSEAIAAGARLHGRDLMRNGFTVSAVVHNYGDVCQAITDVAVETSTRIESEGFRTLNRCLDDAIAAAVTAHASELLFTRDRAAQAALQAWVDTAISAFEALHTGRVGVSGSTGALLGRTLYRMGDYIRSHKTIT